MRNFKHLSKIILSLLLILMFVLSFTACGKKNSINLPEGVVMLHVDFSAIDPNSVTENEKSTAFTAVADDGTQIRFEGMGLSFENGALVMQPAAKLFSLDYPGQILSFYAESDVEHFETSFGFAFANTSNPESMTDLAAALPASSITGSESLPIDLSEYNTGFLVFGPSQHIENSIAVKSLVMTVDTNVPQILFSDLDPSSVAYDLLYGEYGYRIDWKNSFVYETGISPENYALEKISAPGVLKSDIIAGIDRSSIVTEGTTTFFSSTMCDGTVVRFEGENIKIDDNGIYITPESNVTSLDAVGKIYGYYPTVLNHEQYVSQSANFHVGYAYTYSASKTAVERASDVHSYNAYSQLVGLLDGQYLLPTAVFEPNFFNFRGYSYDEGEFYVSSLVACYDPSQKVTLMTEAKLDTTFSTYYLEGELYDSSREQSADVESQKLDFYLILKPDTEIASMADNSRSVYYVPSKFYEVGALRDAAGNELDKKTALISMGCTLDLHVGDSSIKMPLDVVSQYRGAATMNDLVPYAYPSALGELNTLVVPVIWADHTQMANADTLNLFRKGIGRITDEQGNITDYSDTSDKKFSLSEYYDIASYGKMKITSFMTDWYYSDENFSEMWNQPPSEVYSNEIMDWVRATYPNMDWSKYDRDGNGYIDSMVILNAGIKDSEEVIIISYSGAVNYMHSYYGDHTGTQDAPRVNIYTNVGYDWIKNDYNTIIHEFAHGLGIIDYYDVRYSGIDAVGQFDMQSQSYGDWNAYSKLSVGWMDPQVVGGLSSGESMEFTIGSSALTDDVLIIPAADTVYDGPFGEYVMIDLFTDDGVNEYDTDVFGLTDAAGVRISHVNALMEKRTNQVDSVVNPGTSAEYTIGTIHTPNSYTGNETGKYNLEVIQAGGVNTFTNVDNLETILDKDDLFYAGDTFAVEDYAEFFYNGRMDNGLEFGYTVEIVSINNDANGIPTATVRVTRK